MHRTGGGYYAAVDLFIRKYTMARLNEEQALAMLFNSDFYSGGESEIDEDLAFPLPKPEEAEHSPSPPPQWRYCPETDESDGERGSGRETSPLSESVVDEEWESERGRGYLRRGRGRRARGREAE